MTLQLTVMAAVVALALAFVVGLGRLSRWRLVRWAARTYVEIFRGVSALVFLFFVFYVLPIFGLTLDPVPSAVLALGVINGAYGSEVVRGAILTVDVGQRDAAVALNMTPWLTMRRIILPQAVTLMLPPFGNMIVDLLKATSLVSLIAVTELTFAGHQLLFATGRYLEVNVLVLVIYFVIAQPFAQLTRFLERRRGRGLQLGRPT